MWLPQLVSMLKNGITLNLHSCLMLPVMFLEGYRSFYLAHAVFGHTLANPRGPPLPWMDNLRARRYILRFAHTSQVLVGDLSCPHSLL